MLAKTEKCILTKRGWGVWEFFYHKVLFPAIIPFKSFWTLSVAKIPQKSRNSQSCDANFSHGDNCPSSFCERFRGPLSYFYENIHTKRLVTLYARGLVTMSKDNLRGGGRRYIWEVNSLTTDALLIRTAHAWSVYVCWFLLSDDENNLIRSIDTYYFLRIRCSFGQNKLLESCIIRTKNIDVHG